MRPSWWRRDIQGLRAIAVLSVVLFHSGIEQIPGGFLGVDIFFVISGYLISQILLREHAEQRYSLIGFYERRIRRLFPALLVVLLATLVAGFVLLTPEDFKQLCGTAAAAGLFVSNLAFFKLADYFASGADLKPLLHTWSLAVEEQFYIIFPLVLAILWRFWRHRLALSLLMMTVFSFALSVWVTEVSQRIAFYLPFARAFELLLGAWVGVSPDLLKRAGKRTRAMTSLCGLLLISASILLIEEHSFAIPGWVAAIPCIGTGLVLAAGRHGETAGAQLIGSAPFQLFGNLSYSLYLWHWPIFVFARHALLRPLTPPESAIAIAASVLAAYLSWRFVEQPVIVRLPRSAIPLAGAAMGALVAVSAALFSANGLPARFSEEARRFAAARQDFSPYRKLCHISGHTLRSYNSTCVIGAPTARVAVWADSHGVELSVELAKQLARSNSGIRQITASACPPVLDFALPGRPLCRQQNAITILGLTNDSSVHTIVLGANVLGYQTGREALLAGLERSIVALRAAGKTVVLVGQIPNQHYDPPSALSLLAHREQQVSRWGLSRTQASRESGDIIAAQRDLSRRTGSVFVDPTTVLCDKDRCPAIMDQQVLYFNANHISIAGARVLAHAVAKYIRLPPPSGKIQSVEVPY